MNYSTQIKSHGELIVHVDCHQNHKDIFEILKSLRKMVKYEGYYVERM